MLPSIILKGVLFLLTFSSPFPTFFMTEEHQQQQQMSKLALQDRFSALVKVFQSRHRRWIFFNFSRDSIQHPQFYWWCGHVCMVANALLYFMSVLSLHPYSSYYKRAYAGSLVSYGIVIWKSIGVGNIEGG